MKYPLLLCCILFIVGTFVGIILPTNYVIYFAITVVLAIVLRYLFFSKSQIIPLLYITILLLLLTAGVCRASFVRNYNLSEIKPFVDQQIQLCGEVVAIDEYDTSTLLDIKAYWVECNNVKKETNTKIRVQIYGNYTKYELRDILALSGRLDKLPQMQFWGDISKRSVYGAKGIFAQVNARAKNAKVIGHNDLKLDLLQLGFMARDRISKIIDKNLPNDEGALLKGILVGDKSDFTEEMSNNFKLSGLSHIVAVSGVNISIFLMFIAYLINYFGIKRKINAVIMFVAIIIFMVIIGDQPTVLRAGVMMLFTIFMVNLKLRNDMTSSLFFATFVLVMINPYLTHDIGFQLSFFAVLGLILYVDKIGKNVLLAGVSVFVVITPILAYYFNIITFASLLSNIIIEPLFVILLPIGYIIWLVPYLIMLLYPLLKIMLFVSEFFASIEFLQVKVASPTIPVLVICIVLLYILYEWLIDIKNLKSKKVFIAFLILVAVITNLGYNIIVNKNTVEVNFISVGQAQAIHIKTLKGVNILIDSGLAQSKVRLYLTKKGVSKLDLLLVTNYSAGHSGGVADLVENFKVDRLMLPEDKRENREFEDSIKNPNNTDIVYYNGASDIKIDETTTLKILMHNKYAKSAKNASAVIQLKCCNSKIMLPSDIDVDGERELINTYKSGELQSDILLVGRNGMETSTSEEFINAVKPKYPIISAGKTPSEVILQRLNNLVRPPIRTDIFGTVSVKIGKNGIKSIDTTRFGDE